MKRYNKRWEAWKANARWEKYHGEWIDFSTTSPNMEVGDHILFQWITSNADQQEISRPIYAIFVGWSVWDQALVMNYVERLRAWMSNCEILTNPDPKYMYHMKYSAMDPVVENIALWDDNIKLLGWWKAKPSIGQLRQAIKETPGFEIKEQYVKINY